MKKFFLVLTISWLLTLVGSSLVLATNKITISYDMAGEYGMYHDFFHQHKHKHTPNDVDPGFAIGYECTHKVRRVEFGGGLETQLNRSLSQNKDSEFRFTQLYGVIYVNFKNEGNILPFFVGRLGYNTHTGNDVFKNEVYGSDPELGNGIYYAVGFGLHSEHNMLAILYSINHSNHTMNTTIESDGSTKTSPHDANYEKISLVYGLKF